MEPPLVLLLLPFCFVAWRATIGPSEKDIMCMQGKRKSCKGKPGQQMHECPDSRSADVDPPHGCADRRPADVLTSDMQMRRQQT
jgi:hypothetical protein